jgi:antitoxin (DNA-binding transcriptional repressor) of toxin-antitoxin stability system
VVELEVEDLGILQNRVVRETRELYLKNAEIWNSGNQEFFCLCKFLCSKRIEAGEELLITDRGKFVAKTVSIVRGDLPPHLMEMERNGLIRIGTGKIKKSFWTLPRPSDIKSSARNALLREREESR